MHEIQQLLTTLKRHLKAKGLTYKDVGAALDLSEPSVKRLFGKGQLPLDRLARLCALVDLTLAELTQEAASQTPRLRRLQARQEEELVSDPRLLLIATCALNHWTMADIIDHYAMDEPECLRGLLRLDRMRLIDLMPGNRIRLNISRDFEWLPGGAIERYFTEHGRDDFLSGGFDGAGNPLFFVHGMLSAEARRQLLEQVQRLRQQFAHLHEASLQVPFAERRGTALLLGARTWEPPAFAALRRPQSAGQAKV